MLADSFQYITAQVRLKNNVTNKWHSQTTTQVLLRGKLNFHLSLHSSCLWVWLFGTAINTSDVVKQHLIQTSLFQAHPGLQDWCSTTVMQALYWTVVVTRELSLKAKLFLQYQAGPTLTLGHEVWIVKKSDHGYKWPKFSLQGCWAHPWHPWYGEGFGKPEGAPCSLTLRETIWGDLGIS